jgi:hypothetical protein
MRPSGGAVAAVLITVSALGAPSSYGADRARAPEVAFPSEPAFTVKTVAEGCAAQMQTVPVVQAQAVTCELPLDFAERLAARLLLGQLFAPAPRAFVQFTVAPGLKASSRVQVVGWTEGASPRLSRRSAELTGPDFQAQMQAFLCSLGGHALIG